eukprot:4047044-Pleurochrysis_carterae.AAC.2
MGGKLSRTSAGMPESSAKMTNLPRANGRSSACGLRMKASSPTAPLPRQLPFTLAEFQSCAGSTGASEHGSSSAAFCGSRCNAKLKGPSCKERNDGNAQRISRLAATHRAEGRHAALHDSELRSYCLFPTK